jgi:hypothetical protein
MRIPMTYLLPPSRIDRRWKSTPTTNAIGESLKYTQYNSNDDQMRCDLFRKHACVVAC